MAIYVFCFDFSTTEDQLKRYPLFTI